MGLLSDMRGYLQRVQAGETTMLAERCAIDRQPLRRLVLEAVAEDDARKYRMDWRSRDRLLSHPDALISEVIQQIADAPGLAASEDLPRFVTAGLTEVLCDHHSMERRDGLGSDSLGPVQRSLVDRAAESAWTKHTERMEDSAPSHRLYALELGLIQAIDRRPNLAPLGEVFLRMTGTDATRWPIAIELLTAIDRDDPWRGHESLAAYLVKRRTLMGYHHEFQYGSDWPWDNPALRRWTGLGLLKRESWEAKDRPDEPDGGVSFTLTELGARLLEELLREPDAPIKSFARAMLEDASDVMLDVVPSRHSGAAASVVRHTRMLAHELRNRLVPVRIFYDQLWKRLPRDDVRVALHRQHTKIVEGLDQALRFVTESAHAVSSFADEATFLAASALQDACDTAATSAGASADLKIAPGADDIHLRGPRQRLLMALVNLLRNSVQAGGPDVKIVASLYRAEGYVAVVALEDSGPGIPEAQRDKVFANGHSTHAHGTGHGLALVREVVEQDFSGSVHYEVSPLGGARFVLRFPIPSEGT